MITNPTQPIPGNLSSIVSTTLESELELKQTVLIYGDSFSGKTYLAAQLARKYHLIWFDFENGWSTILKALPKEYCDNITLIRVKDAPDSPKAFDTTLKFLKATKGEVSINLDDGSIGRIIPGKEQNLLTINTSELNTKYCIVFDTLSALSDSSMANYIGKTDGLVFAKKGFTHYDHQGLYLNNILIKAQQHPAHTVFLTHLEELEQEDGTAKLTPTCGTRNNSRKTPRKFDHVIHCSIKNKQHSYNSSTTKDNKIIAGSRFDFELTKAEDICYLFNAYKEFALGNGGTGKKDSATGAIKSDAAKLRL